MDQWRTIANKGAHRTATKNSQCEDFGPAEGSGVTSKMVEFEGSLRKPTLFPTLPDITPVWFEFHCANAAEDNAGSRRRLSKLSLPFTLNMFASRTWSERFLPTEGLSTTTGICRASRSARGPIPESCRICGVFIVPAERIISLVADTTKGATGGAVVLAGDYSLALL